MRLGNTLALLASRSIQRKICPANRTGVNAIFLGKVLGKLSSETPLIQSSGTRLHPLLTNASPGQKIPRLRIISQ
jgi:hypothetical protein